MARLETLFGLDATAAAAEDGDNPGSRTTWKSNFIPQEYHQRTDDTNFPADVKERVLYKIGRNPFFRIGVNCIILINAIQMGAAADLRDDSWISVWEVCDHFFTFVFAAEMVIMVSGLRGYYFIDPWNWLDFLIAWIAIVDTWIFNFIGYRDEDKRFGVFRVFRIMRLLRLVKIMHVVPELMMVVEGIIGSLKSMFWIFLLLLIVLYACGICCVEVVGQDENHYPAWTKAEEAIEDEMVQSFNSYLYFGTVGRAMVSLFNVVLLDEWATVTRPIFEMQRLMIVFFILLVLLCSFGILNVIIGVVVERTTQAMSVVRQSHIEKLKGQQMRQVKSLAKIMFRLDEDGNSFLSRDEFEKGSENMQLQEMLGDIELPAGFTFSEMFTMLDIDGDGWLSKSELVDGIMRLIYSSDFQRDCMQSCGFGMIKQSQNHIQEQLKSLIAEVQTDVRQLREELHASFRNVRLESTQQDPKSSQESSFGGAIKAQPTSVINLQDSASSGINVEGQVFEKNKISGVPVAQDIGNLTSQWEPVQMSAMPMKLLVMHPPSSASSLVTSATTEVTTSVTTEVRQLKTAVSDNASHEIVGFLPVLGFSDGCEAVCKLSRDVQYLPIARLDCDPKQVMLL